MSAFNYKKLFIHNIDYKTSYEEIFDAFDSIGKLRYCDVPVDRNKRLKGYAFVEFYDSKLAEIALNRLNNTHIGIRAIKIEYSNKMKEGSTIGQAQGGRQEGGRHYENRYEGPRNEQLSPRRFQRSTHRSPIRSPIRSPDRSRDRSIDRIRRRSRDYEHSEESKRKVSRSPSDNHSKSKLSSQEIRKSYTTSFYSAGEFYDETLAPGEMENFLKKTKVFMKEGPIVMETTKRSEKYEDRRMSKREYSRERSRRDNRDRYSDNYGRGDKE